MEVIGDMRKALMLEAEIKLVFPYNSHIIQQKNLLTLLSNSSKISVYLISLLLLPWLIPHHLLPVRGVCNFLGSVSPQQRFVMVDQYYPSVTAQNFIQQTKESTPFRHEGRLTTKEGPILPPLFTWFVSSPWTCPMYIGLGRRAVCFTWGSHFSPRIFFCFIFTGFSLPLSFSHCHFGLFFPILTT